jgi:phosphoglycerate dehydrogenase-like enzyme
MTELLFVQEMPEDVRAAYCASLRKNFPGVTVNAVGHFSKAEPYLASADVILTFGHRNISDETLRAAKNLKWVQALGTGIDGIADRLVDRKHVLITTTTGIHGAPVSETALAGLFALSRDIPRAVRTQDAKQRETWVPRLLYGKTVGILGSGTIALAMAPRCKALGMTVIGISAAPRSAPGFDDMVARDRLPGIVGTLDYLVLMTSLSPGTRGIVSAGLLKAMKPSSYLVNVARGDLIDEPALIEALRKDEIAGAALDVFSVEPLPEGHPFWSMKNVIITHHLAGTHDRKTELTLSVIESNLRHFLAGEVTQMLNLVPR